METKKFNINASASAGVSTIEIREGAALPLLEPKAINYTGTLESVLRFINNRLSLIPMEDSFVTVDREKMKISLVVGSKNPFSDFIVGKLEPNSEMEDWRINTGEAWSHKDLAEKVKMFRYHFVNNTEAMKLSSELKDVKIKIAKELEKTDNNRGDQKIMVARKVIENNIPEKFVMSIPVFKSRPKETFEVEIYLDPETALCRLISPELNDLIQKARDTAIDEQLKAIDEAAPGLLILEQ